jgi:hypothetical protein
MLLIFGGLPAVGKTAIAVGLARAPEAVHLRIDSIEQALRNSSATISGPEGYLVAYALAEDNLRLGRTVIADSVNPDRYGGTAYRGERSSIAGKPGRLRAGARGNGRCRELMDQNEQFRQRF